MADDYDPAQAPWPENNSYVESNPDNAQSGTIQQAEYNVGADISAAAEEPEYDPASLPLTIDPAPAPQATSLSPQVPAAEVPLRPSPQRAAPPKKKPRTAGGFIADSDSEDEAPAKNAPAQPAANNAGAAEYGVAAKPATLVPESTTTTPVPPPVPTVDRIAQLEDRVREDPRGAMDAWLGLILEHRARNDIEKARATYERFFAVFPQAVCSLSLFP